MEALPCLRRLASWLEPSVPEASPPWRTACRAKGTEHPQQTEGQQDTLRPRGEIRRAPHGVRRGTTRIHCAQRIQQAQQAQQAQRQLTAWERAREGMPVVTCAPAASTDAASVGV